MTKKNIAYNNDIECGLRAVTLLAECYPKSLDLSKLVFLDYFLIHSGDFEQNIPSLHAPTPHRKEEVKVRRHLLESGLELFMTKGLVEPRFFEDGFYFIASENTTPYLDMLSSDYSKLLKKRAEWVIRRFGNYTVKELKQKFNNSSNSSTHGTAFSAQLSED